MELMIALGGVDVPILSLRKQMAASINLIVQINRQLGGQRKVVSISEISGMEGDTISMHEIFRYTQTGVENNAAFGHFESLGIRPVCLERLLVNGVELSPQLFLRRRLEPRTNGRGGARG
jgi:pilus assembly protein CpaF